MQNFSINRWTRNVLLWSTMVFVRNTFSAKRFEVSYKGIDWQITVQYQTCVVHFTHIDWPHLTNSSCAPLCTVWSYLIECILTIKSLICAAHFCWYCTQCSKIIHTIQQKQCFIEFMHNACTGMPNIIRVYKKNI